MAVKKGRSQARRNSGNSGGLPGWAWMVLGIVVTLAVVLGAPRLLKSDGDDGFYRPRANPDATPAQATSAGDEDAALPPAASSDPDYDFYTLLPESEQLVPESSVPTQAPAEPPKTDDAKPQDTTRFFLQAGSFRKRTDADRVRAQILLLGLDVKLEDAKLGDGETWYRVQVGPFQDRSSVTEAQKTLAGNGYDNLLLQQRTETR